MMMSFQFKLRRGENYRAIQPRKMGSKCIASISKPNTTAQAAIQPSTSEILGLSLLFMIDLSELRGYR